MARSALRPAAIRTLALCVALGAGCTNRLGPAPPPSSGGTGLPIPPGGGRDAGVTIIVDGAAGTFGTDAAVTCIVPLAQTGCAATYTAQLATDPACAIGVSGSQAGGCGPYFIWSSGLSNGLGSQTCVYDVNQLTLVSATVCTDIATYCNRDFCASAGRGIDPSAICDLTALPLVCPNTDGPIVIDAGSADADGGAASCPQPSLNTPWTVLSGCIQPTPLTMRCPLPGRINDPTYPPFVGCCPPDAPFACGNGTPNSCFSTAEEAAASCGSACIQCTAYSDGPIPP